MKRTPQATVASGHPAVSRAAAVILTDGGNAFDAAVAAGFASAVAEPPLTSLGGGGFLLARTAAGDETLFDFFTDTPGKGRAAAELEPHFFPVTVTFAGSDQDFNIGLGSVAVPGTLRGLLHVHQRLGRLPLAAVVAPAVTLARQGVTITPHQSYFFGLLRPIMTLTEEGRRIHAPNGRYLTVGDRFRNPDLADFIEELPQTGGHDFYCGGLAARIAADMEEGQGLLSEEDLAGYRVVERRPLVTSYRGHRLLTNPLPSFGGTLIALALQLLDRLSFDRTDWGSTAHLEAAVAVMEEVERNRRAIIDHRLRVDPAWCAAAVDRLRGFSRGTTHVSVVDAAGNVASMTTSNGEGSGYLVPGTGIMLNNMMGEDDLHPDGFHASPAGHRVASMMAPSILLADDRVILVLGSGGSKRIRTAITQVISNVVDFGLSVEAAVCAPRLHWDGDTLQVEPGYSEEVLEELRQRWPLNVWPQREVYFGGVHAVAPGRGGAGDPRRGGEAASVTTTEEKRPPGS